MKKTNFTITRLANTVFHDLEVNKLVTTCRFKAGIVAALSQSPTIDRDFTIIKRKSNITVYPFNIAGSILSMSHRASFLLKTIFATEL